MNTIQSSRPEVHTSHEYYASHPEGNRTLRMDGGGICQLCAGTASRRVELHSPLWPSGPILYGECCLPKAEAALRGLVPGETPPEPVPLNPPVSFSRKAWLTAMIVVVSLALAATLECLIPIGHFF